MVSFQCDACQDVVKKPKLDQHRARGCGAGFTCIDCSTSFPTPADWKGHTTCVSEAQKYQGSLYRGPKANGGGREHRTGFSSANGKFQGGRGGSWGARPPTRYQPTGANGTPLGTPSRMSPVTTPTPSIETSKAKAIPAESAEEDKAQKKRNIDVGTGQITEALKLDDVPKAQDELKAAKTKDAKEKKEKKGKKEKKDKHKKSNAAISEPTINGLDEPHGEALPSSSGVDPAAGTSEKESKKSKKEKRKANGEVSNAQEDSGRDVVVDSTINGDDTKEKERKKDNDKKKKKKEKKHAEPSLAAAGEAPMAIDAEPEEKKKSKKRKREAEEQVKSSEDATTGETENAKKKKKQKKSTARDI